MWLWRWRLKFLKSKNCQYLTTLVIYLWQYYSIIVMLFVLINFLFISYLFMCFHMSLYSASFIFTLCFLCCFCAIFFNLFFLLVSVVIFPIYAASANKVEKLYVSEQACVNERRFSKKNLYLIFWICFLRVKKKKEKKKVNPFPMK